ncbi:MarR family transcriptional regulator [Aquabacter sp. CN5-332]|uniref:MarR family transcriptional regulator n=1 Tax=Aquabacter sp. CN5-332 TaxID=3156608 RepID=UPI0032B5D56F
MRKAQGAEWRGLTFGALVSREILDNPLDNETPQSRVKQIGMMVVLHHLHLSNQRLTLTNISEFTGLTRGGVTETIDQLIRRKILTETLTTNSMGRGRAREFNIARGIFERLRNLKADGGVHCSSGPA